MLSFKLSFFLAFFLWAFTLEAAPAMHHHRHGNQHLRHLHATRAALLHRARSHNHHGAPQVLFEEPQKPSQSVRAQAVPDQEMHHSVERLTV
ncbi:hypothetical protein FOC1_g10015508 [Fusarium oxysporum f. sp. cubense race 1]|uniref:Uncharacterized protein n=1 Tax=Fusarium oxysporum f. sp. cubense (strain race 1) TaxID=1229664 RepID=N4TNI5_FUSC1|nr:hypothetical protein FOC1_g10015508 [Fusarium oxysporum f. sp. cubense race 1]